jgi:myo-inositol-1(or 4)-monophosphatase
MIDDPIRYLAPMEVMSRHAGQILMQHFRKLESIEMKGDIDIVTIADKSSEEFLVKEILRQYPDHAVLGEEGGRAGNADSDFLWVLDPLDGTTNYAHGMRIFAVSIGLLYKGERIAGVVNVPALDEVYTAAKGNGARRNGERIHVSQRATLKEALLVTGFPYDRVKHADVLTTMIREVIAGARGLLRLGAAAYDFCLVAAGNLDAFYEYGLRPWDMAAGTLIVEEAGGHVSGLTPDEPFDLFKPRVVASNGAVHHALHEALLRGGVDRMPPDFDN